MSSRKIAFIFFKDSMGKKSVLDQSIHNALDKTKKISVQGFPDRGC